VGEGEAKRQGSKLQRIVSDARLAFFIYMDEIKDKQALSEGFRIFTPKLPPKKRVFKGLPIRHQVVCILRLAKFTYKQIVPYLGISEKTAKRWIIKAKEKYPILKEA